MDEIEDLALTFAIEYLLFGDKKLIAKNNDDTEWITVKGNHIPIKDGQSKAEAIEEFLEKKVEKQSKRDKIKKYRPKEIKLPKTEYAKVMHELNTNLPIGLKKKKVFRRSIGNYIYKIQNKGFNEFIIIGKYNIDEMHS